MKPLWPSPAGTALIVPVTRGSEAGQKVDQGYRQGGGVKFLERSYWVKVLRSVSWRLSHTSSWISWRTRLQRSPAHRVRSVRHKPDGRLENTQAITLDCAWWLRGPRASQTPSRARARLAQRARPTPASAASSADRRDRASPPPRPRRRRARRRRPDGTGPTPRCPLARASSPRWPAASRAHYPAAARRCRT
jgi:hypothetical protein